MTSERERWMRAVMDDLTVELRALAGRIEEATGGRYASIYVCVHDVDPHDCAALEAVGGRHRTLDSGTEETLWPSDEMARDHIALFWAPLPATAEAPVPAEVAP